MDTFQASYIVIFYINLPAFGCLDITSLDVGIHF